MRLAWTCLLGLFLSLAAAAEENDRDRIVINYLLRISEAVEWPQNKEASFRIVVFSAAETKLLRDLKDAAKSFRIHGKQIEVSSSSELARLPEADLIFVPTGSLNSFRDILFKTEGRPVLLITENYENQRLMMVNLVYSKSDKRIRFAINKANLLNQKLVPGKQLILLGGTEVDVAKLYREGQESLLAMEGRVSALEKRLLDSQVQLKEQSAALAAGQALAEQQKKDLASKELALKAVNAQIDAAKQIEARIAADLKAREGANAALKRELQTTEEKLAKAREAAAENGRLAGASLMQLKQLESEKQSLVEKIALSSSQYLTQSQQLHSLKLSLEDITDDLHRQESGALQARQEAQQAKAEAGRIRDGIQGLIQQKESIAAELASQKVDLSRKNRFVAFLLGAVILVSLLILFIIRGYRKLSRQRSLLASRNAELRQTQASLLDAREEALRSSAFKSSFLTNMSHEIRTPLNGVIGLTQLLAKTDLDRRQQDYLGKLSFSARSLLGVINDILDFAKIEAGKLSAQPLPCHPEEVIMNSLAIVPSLIGDKEIEVVADIRLPLQRHALLDSIRLGQILHNLLSNAAKFTPAGQILVKARHRDEGASAVLEISVSDSGIGMDEQTQAKLFSPFVQADASTTRKYGGSGLGLSICRELCRLMGGDIGLRSSPGQGSTFSFWIRFDWGEALPPPRDLSHLKDRFVLVVDEHPLSLEILVRQLQDFGLRVSAHTEASAALEWLARQDRWPDYFLLDWKMTGMNGGELARRIHELRPGAESEFCMISSRPQECPDLPGMQCPLHKPVSSSSLLDFLVKSLPSGSPQQAQPKPLEGRRILVAEDQEINQMIIIELLHSAGAHVDLASDGHEAVKRTESAEYDLVLMDIQMPVLDGHEATRRIRAAGGTMPIIAMTAHAFNAEKERCLANGMNDHVSKPFNKEELFELLFRWLKPDQLLVAEDDEINQLILGEILTEAGIPYILCGSGEELIGQWQRQPGCPLILLDLQLPGVDGLATLEELRRLGCTAPIHALSAAPALPPDCKGRFDGYFPKPFDPELGQALLKLLNQTQKKLREPLPAVAEGPSP
ncbi:MAG: hypothetical protein RL095_3108 [Verrucomicrobiota bacterium]|jgi:signal transduction histidine kinase/CheY-like chemotaxis protein